MPEDLALLAEEFEAILPIIMRSFNHMNEEDPLTEIPLMQFRVLKSLFPQAKSVAALAKELRMSPSRLAHLLARLEDAGLVGRYDDENDRRIRYAGLTERGQEMMHHRRTNRRAGALRLLEKLSEDERARVMWALKLLRERAGTLAEAPTLEAELDERIG